MDDQARQLMSLMGRGRSGIKQAVKSTGIAGILADIINAQRMDAKRMAQEQGVEMEIAQMTEDRSAELVADMVNQDFEEFAEVFDDLQAKRDRTLQATLDDDDWDDYYRLREQSLPVIGDDLSTDGDATESETSE